MSRGHVQKSARIALRPVRQVVHDRAGATAVEFGLLAPVLFLMIFAMIQFGLVMNAYIEVTEASRAGARNFSMSRATGVTNPASSTVTLIEASAPNLTAASMNVTLQVSGNATPCAPQAAGNTSFTGDDSACENQLNAAPGGTATVEVTYPCNTGILNLTDVMGANFAAGCNLKSTTSDIIE